MTVVVPAYPGKPIKMLSAKVTYCEGTMCYTSPLEPEYSTLHSIGIPPGMKGVTITAIVRDGQTVSNEVR